MCSIDSACQDIPLNDVRAHALDLKRAHALDLTRYGFAHISNFLAQNLRTTYFSASLINTKHSASPILPKTLVQQSSPKTHLPNNDKEENTQITVNNGALCNPAQCNGTNQCEGRWSYHRMDKQSQARRNTESEGPNVQQQGKKNNCQKIQGTSCSLYRQTRSHCPPFKVKAVVSSTFSCRVKTCSLPL